MSRRTLRSSRATRLTLMIAMLALPGGVALAGGQLAPHGGLTYIVRGGSMGSVHQHIYITDSDFNDVTDAVVTLNGTDVPHVAGDYYSVGLPEALVPGDGVTLEVQIGTQTITAVDVLPDPAIVVVPSENVMVADGGVLHIEWTCAIDPDEFEISPFPCDGECRQRLDGTERSFDLPIDQYPLGEPVQIRIYAYNHGAFSGPAHPDSKLNLRYSEAPYVEFTVFDPTPAEATSWGMLKARF